MTVADREERPVFVFASGWRSGSTLLQRLLTSHPDLIVWGESRGFVRGLLEAWQSVESLRALSAEQREVFDAEGARGWIPVMNPPLEALAAGMRALLRAYWAEPAHALGRARWGMKEVRCDAASARWLHALFPGARFVFLTRHPARCLASARGVARGGGSVLSEAEGAVAFLAHWRRLARSFREAADLPACTLRYEDLLREPSTALAGLAEHLDLDPTGFDTSILASRRRGWKEPPALERGDRRALRDPALWEEAALHGYDAGAEAPRLRRVGWIRASVR